MYKPVHAIEVSIWGKTVGAVALDPILGYYAFEYDPVFAASGIELAPLSMSLARAREPFVFADLPENDLQCAGGQLRRPYQKYLLYPA